MRSPKTASRQTRRKLQMLFIFRHHRQQGSSLTTPQDRALAQAYQLKQGLLRAPVSRPCILGL